MNLNAALKDLGAATDHIPVETLTWCRDHWDVVGPAARQVLLRCVRDPEMVTDRDAAAGYFLLHIGAERGDGSLAPSLAALARAPDAIDIVFGASAMMTLTPVTISLHGDSVESLFALAQSEFLDEFARASAFEALAYFAKTGAADRARVHDLLARFHADGALQDAPPDGEEAMGGADWTGWARAIALMDDRTLMPLVEDACRTGLVPEELLAFDDLRRIAQIAREEGDGFGAFESEGVMPLTDAVAELQRVEALLESEMEAGEGDEADSDADGDPVGRVENASNPFRDVGRNDPCPCGSGLKFKKCCIGKAA